MEHMDGRCGLKRVIYTVQLKMVRERGGSHLRVHSTQMEGKEGCTIVIIAVISPYVTEYGLFTRGALVVIFNKEDYLQEGALGEGAHLMVQRDSGDQLTEFIYR